MIWLIGTLITMAMIIGLAVGHYWGFMDGMKTAKRKDHYRTFLQEVNR